MDVGSTLMAPFSEASFHEFFAIISSFCRLMGSAGPRSEQFYFHIIKKKKKKERKILFGYLLVSFLSTS